MRTFRHLRLTNLEGFAGALLLTLGVAPIVGCGSSVDADDGAGGAGDGGSTSASSTQASTPASSAASTSDGGASSGITLVSSGEGGSTSGPTGSGGAPTLSDCPDPEPIILEGVDTGYEDCGAYMRRREALGCPEPVDSDCCGDACGGDEYCAEDETGCWCTQQCSTDADCGPGQACLCGYSEDGADIATHCVAASCSGGDCGEGQECVNYAMGNDCLTTRFACTTPEDECRADADCDGLLCQPTPDGRMCEQSSIDCGRPFLVEDLARTATVVVRGDWSARDLVRSSAEPDGSLREALADGWTRIALMEHASIAAFARFALQLLALGAPPEPIERTHEAMRDETRHARLAFGLAARYRGEPVGPGPLAIDGALAGADDVRDFVRLTIREGCIGETVAALEAGEAHALAEDDAVRSVLAEIARDERAHAELAWSAVRWAMGTFGDIARAVVVEELAMVETELRTAQSTAPHVAIDGDLARHGIIGREERAVLRREALARVIAPCLGALLSSEPFLPSSSRARWATLHA